MAQVFVAARRFRRRKPGYPPAKRTRFLPDYAICTFCQKERTLYSCPECMEPVCGFCYDREKHYQKVHGEKGIMTFPNQEQEQRIKTLEEKVAALEERIADSESAMDYERSVYENELSSARSKIRNLSNDLGNAKRDFDYERYRLEDKVRNLESRQSREW